MSGVLVTGATTPLGRRLIARLLEEGRSVIGVALEPAHPYEGRPGFHYQPIDLVRVRNLRNLLYDEVRRRGVETIVHAAMHRSLKKVGRRARRLHVDTTRALLDLAQPHPTLARFVLVSSGEVYRMGHDAPTLIDEHHPLRVASAPNQRIADRVEADLIVASRAYEPGLSVAVLRLGDLFTPDCGSQLYEYVRSRVCLRPAGFDPMLNLLTLEDAAEAICLAAASREIGVFNVPGADILPLSVLIAKMQRLEVPIPGPLMTPLYRLRMAATGFEFSYDLNYERFHFGGILDGRRAERSLGYRPQHPVVFPAARLTGERSAPRLR